MTASARIKEESANAYTDDLSQNAISFVFKEEIDVGPMPPLMMAEDFASGRIRRRQRTKSVQLYALLELLSKDKGLAQGQIQTTLGRQEYNLRWEAITNHLNSLGTAKTSKQWQKVWADLRSRTRATLSNRRNSRTGSRIPLSIVEKRVAALINDGVSATEEIELTSDMDLEDPSDSAYIGEREDQDASATPIYTDSGQLTSRLHPDSSQQQSWPEEEQPQETLQPRNTTERRALRRCLSWYRRPHNNVRKMRRLEPAHRQQPSGHAKTIQKRRRQRTQAAQLDALLNLIAKEKELICGRGVSLMDKATFQKRWEKITAQVNVLGTAKSSSQWQKVWADLRSRTKNSLAAIEAARDDPNGNPPQHLTPLEVRVIALMTGEETSEREVPVPATEELQVVSNVEIEELLEPTPINESEDQDPLGNDLGPSRDQLEAEPPSPLEQPWPEEQLVHEAPPPRAATLKRRRMFPMRNVPWHERQQKTDEAMTGMRIGQQIAEARNVFADIAKKQNEIYTNIFEQQSRLEERRLHLEERRLHLEERQIGLQQRQLEMGQALVNSLNEAIRLFVNNGIR